MLAVWHFSLIEVSQFHKFTEFITISTLIKYPIQTMFESIEFTINPHFIPNDLKPFVIFAPIPMN